MIFIQKPTKNNIGLGSRTGWGSGLADWGSGCAPGLGAPQGSGCAPGLWVRLGALGAPRGSGFADWRSGHQGCMRINIFK